jgi:hypothetical protein
VLASCIVEPVSDGRSSGQAGADGGPPERPAYAVVPLECVECHARSGPEALHWRAYRIDDPTEDEEPAVAFYCPVCAEREFGQLGPWRHEPRNINW